MKKKLIVLISVTVLLLAAFFFMKDLLEKTVAYDSDEKERIAFTSSDVTDYAVIDYKDGNCPNSVIDNLQFENANTQECDIIWTSSNEAVIKTDGTVIRGIEDKDVKVTACIINDGKGYKKDFLLKVKGKNLVNKDKLTDFSIADLDKMNKGDEYYETDVNDYGYIESIYGTYSTVKVDSYEKALMSLYNIKSAMGIKDPFSELVVKRADYDETGYTFEFNQAYEGIEVLDKTVTISADENGNVDCLSSSYFPIKNQIDILPQLTQGEANKALIDLGYKHISAKDKKMVIRNDYGKCDLEWEFHAQKDSTGEEFMILINAHSGEIDEESEMRKVY